MKILTITSTFNLLTCKNTLIINFLEYYNEQNKIISVSHKCTTNNHIKTKNICWGRNNLGRYDTFSIKECSIKSKIREIKGKISN